MSEETFLQEVLSDSDAYFSIGDARSAVDVLLEGLDQFRSDAAAIQSIQSALDRICWSFWANCDFETGREITTIVLYDALNRARTTVDADYVATYARALAVTGTRVFPLQRLFRHCNLVRLFRQIAEKVSGDVVECGCLAGLSFMELCFTFKNTHADWTGEGFHVFDSFEGLSEPTKKDRIDDGDDNAAVVAKNMVRGHFAFPVELAKENIHRYFPRVELHPGWIPSTFAAQAERTYRFVHIDLDLYQPTLDSLNYFFPRLANGGAVLTDDYDWPGARKAFQEFCAERRLHLLTTDTSQAFVFKGADPRYPDSP